jgi:hypothetical protein
MCDGCVEMGGAHVILECYRYRSEGGVASCLQLRGDASEARSGSLISPSPREIERWETDTRRDASGERQRAKSPHHGREGCWP